MWGVLGDALGGISHSTTEVVGAGLLCLLQGAQWAAAHVKGRSGDKRRALRLQTIEEKIDVLGRELHDVRAHVIGPDGQNGLRGDLRELERVVYRRYPRGEP